MADDEADSKEDSKEETDHLLGKEDSTDPETQGQGSGEGGERQVRREGGGGREENISATPTARHLRSFSITEGSIIMDEEREEGAPPGYSILSEHKDHDKEEGAQDGVPPKTNGKKSGSVPGQTDGLTRCLTRMVKLVRSLGGLVFLLLAYTFFGAWIMMTIEGPAEVQHMQQVHSVRETISEQLKNNTDALRAGLLNESEWLRRTDDLLLQLETTVHSAGVATTSKKKWTFFGSVLFCVTTYTTIGYGNIAPSTDAGRIATMLYATIGIPLALIVLADLGRRFTIGLKFLWGYVRRYYYTGYCSKIRKKAAAHSQDMTEAGVVAADGLDPKHDGTYTLSNAGDAAAAAAASVYRDESETGSSEPANRIENEMDAKIIPIEGTGSSSLATFLRKDTEDGGGSGRSQSMERASSSGIQEQQQHGSREASPPHAPGKKSQSHSGSVFIDQEELSEDFKLPVLVAVGFIFAYIFLGAGLYKLWEDWTYLESFYFVFITVSTIGFGDVLPKHPNFFLLSCVYTFLGLALVSMTINVISEWLAKTIDRAKLRVEMAREKAIAKAKAATDKLTEVGSKAKHKVLHTVAREGSSSPQLQHQEVTNNTHSTKQSARTAGHYKRHSHDTPAHREESPQNAHHYPAHGPHLDYLKVQEKGDGVGAGDSAGFDLPTPSSGNETSFRTATEFAASSDSINEQTDRH